MRIPESMADELSAWNNGRGIDLDAWVGCVGSFGLAVGYASLLWPRFVRFEDYILTEGFSEQQVRDCRSRPDATAMSIEWLLNHRHIADFQHHGCPDISRDKLILLGSTLREIYQAKLTWAFPDSPCVVEFYQPDDPDALQDYQISFWQAKHAAA